MVRVGESVGGCEPSESQLHFLKACLLPNHKALKAWTRWNESHSLDVVDEALFRQLALLYWNLKQAGYAGAETATLKGIARRTWYSNQVIFRCLAAVFRDFTEAGIPLLLLKGAAWGHLYYPDPYTRHMNDGDFMVPLDRLDDAIAILLRSGWRPVFPLSENYATTQHAAGFINKDGQEIDLHWHLLYECCGAEDDDGYWQRATPFTFQGFNLQTLGTTDHLFHILMHGYRWNPLHPLRWVTDACMLLKTKNEPVDWRLLVENAKRSGLTLRLRQSLRYLVRHFSAPVPLWVEAWLLVIPVSAKQRLEHIQWVRADLDYPAPFRLTLWPWLQAWLLHSSRHEEEPLYRRFLGFCRMVIDQGRPRRVIWY